MKEIEVSKWKESRRRQNKSGEVSRSEKNSKKVKEEGNSANIQPIISSYLLKQLNKSYFR